jgi:PAS domain S-box-containing protein
MMKLNQLDMLPLGVLISNREGRIVGSNREIRKILSSDERELADESIYELVSPDCITRLMEDVELLHEGSCCEERIFFRIQEEDLGPFDAIFAIEEGGRIVFVFAPAGHDGIPSIGSELIQNSNAIVVGLDMDGRIKLFNSGAQRVLGYDRDEVLGKGWFDLLMEENAGKGDLEVLKWDIGSGFNTRYENRIRSESGRILTISWENTVIIDEKDEISMVMMVGQDITNMKLMEDSLRKRGEDLAGALREISIYNDLMLHDMKNTTTAVMGYLQLITMKGVDEEKRKEYARRALNEVRKSSSIINDVKIMAKAQSPVNLEPVNIDECLGSACGRFGDSINAGSPVISYDGCKLTVLADDLLEDAFLRLFRFIRDRVDSDDLNIEVSLKRDPSLQKFIPDPVHVTVLENKGIMGEDEMDKAMVEVPLPGEVSGRLGLYLVRKIIGRYGGKFWMEEKEPGTATHFVIREAV